MRHLASGNIPTPDIWRPTSAASCRAAKHHPSSPGTSCYTRSHTQYDSKLAEHTGTCANAFLFVLGYTTTCVHGWSGLATGGVGAQTQLPGLTLRVPEVHGARTPTHHVCGLAAHSMDALRGGALMHHQTENKGRRGRACACVRGRGACKHAAPCRICPSHQGAGPPLSEHIQAPPPLLDLSSSSSPSLSSVEQEPPPTPLK